jgi:subtilisin family serine protease
MSNSRPDSRRAAAPALIAAIALLLPALAPAQGSRDWRDKIAPAVQERAKREASVPVVLRLAGEDDLSKLPNRDFGTRVAAAVERLQRRAQAAQAPLLAELAERGRGARGFWIANSVVTELGAAEAEQFALRKDVLRIEPAWPLRREQPKLEQVPARIAKASEPGVALIRAPDAWALGFRGQGVVVAGQDSGYQWDHPALRTSYRGWNGTSASHAYHWHDAITAEVPNSAPGNPCGFATTAPCDDGNHGSHTMGTMVGDDGAANQIGVAPAARWIGCRNMDEGWGSPATYLDCMQWLMAPTDLAGANPDPARAPHVINNSWACPPSEGCAIETLAEAVRNLRAAGILFVASAGNSGPFCSTVQSPPAIYDDSLSIGATLANGQDLAGFSSRGPVLADGSGRLKPDLVAPGSAVRSSIVGGYGLISGTSMAAPHVAGVAALMMSANPALRGQPAVVESLMRRTAVPLTGGNPCGGEAQDAVPNYRYGYGRVDALAAVTAARDYVHADGFD